jgi:hypothetical protein
VDAQKVQELTGLTAPPAYELISKLEKLAILKEFTGAKRGRQFIFEDYLKIFTDE